MPVVCCNRGNTGKMTGGQALPFQVDLEMNISNIRSVPLSSLERVTEYIPLETDTACMLSRIAGVSLCDSLIFVSDGSRLLCFDRKGKFLYTVGSPGRGPDEYNYVRSFYADNISKEIYLLSMGKVLIFGFDGKLKGSFKADFRPSQVITGDQNRLIFHLFNLSGPMTDTASSWYITDKQGITLEKIKNHNPRKSQPGLLVPDSPLYNYGGTTHLLEFGNDTLYYFNGPGMDPYAIFSAGKLRMDPDLLLTPDTFKEISERIKGKVWIRDVKENDDYLFIKLSWGLSDSVSYCLFDKSDSEVTVLKENGFTDDINGGLAFWPQDVFADHLMVDHAEALTLLKAIKAGRSGSSVKTGQKISSELEELGNRIDENSNPVLIVLR